MPLCYGGGIKNLNQFEKIVNLGVEKISMSSSAILNDEILTEASKSFGNQSVIVTLDIKKLNNQYFVYIENGSKKVDISLDDIVKKVQDNGAGELIFNLIDKEEDRPTLKNGEDKHVRQ